MEPLCILDSGGSFNNLRNFEVDMTQKCIIHFDDGSTAVFEGEEQFPVGDKRRVVKVQFTKPQETGGKTPPKNKEQK